jgi:hypothetical protein
MKQNSPKSNRKTESQRENQMTREREMGGRTREVREIDRNRRLKFEKSDDKF